MRDRLLYHRASQYLVLAGTLLFASLFVSGGVFSSMGTPGEEIATVVGMSAGVAPNEYNQLAQELSQKEAQLSAREADLVAREAAQGTASSDDIRRANTRTLVALSVALFILFILVSLNFYFDIRRARSSEEEPHRTLHHEGELQTRL